MSNSVDSDETAHNEPSHLDLCCLQKPIIITCGSERVNSYKSDHVYLKKKKKKKKKNSSTLEILEQKILLRFQLSGCIEF